MSANSPLVEGIPDDIDSAQRVIRYAMAQGWEADEEAKTLSSLPTDEILHEPDGEKELLLLYACDDAECFIRTKYAPSPVGWGEFGFGMLM